MSHNWLNYLFRLWFGLMSKNEKIKLILCGDSAVGKSKLGESSCWVIIYDVIIKLGSVERFLLDDYSKHTSSTYAITKYIQEIKVDGIGQVTVDLWDTAGQVLLIWFILWLTMTHRNGSCHFILVFIMEHTRLFLFLM